MVLATKPVVFKWMAPRTVAPVNVALVVLPPCDKTDDQRDLAEIRAKPRPKAILYTTGIVGARCV